MKISINWLKDYVDLPNLSLSEFLNSITLSVCEVEKIEQVGAHLSQVRVAEVLLIEKHPNADSLSLVTVDLGNAEEFRVVCGASNFSIGDKVPYAGIGCILPGNFQIKKAKIRGIESLGMLCAEDELGFSENHDGLMILEKNVRVGQNLAELFLDSVDIILDIDNKSLTHRPDLWGHYGFAREMSALYEREFKPYPENKDIFSGTGKSLIEVVIDDHIKIPRFSGLSVTNVKVQESSLHIRHRLYRVGLRAINNLIDITNYVMLDYGQPMHVFDVDQVAGQKLHIKTADTGEKMMTLYKKEAVLTPDDMVIYDDEGPTAIAGVIGGTRSGINETTSSIYLEAGNWDAAAVRQTSYRIGVRTDACQRYEKSLDSVMTIFAIARSVELLRITCPELKIIGPLHDSVNFEKEDIVISFSPDRAQTLLGKNIEHDEMKSILIRLGFRILSLEKCWNIQVPSWRSTKDVGIREDLVEEIGRLHDFNTIVPSAPYFPIERPKRNDFRIFERKAKGFLVDNGFHEVLGYPLSCKEEEAELGINPQSVLRLVNPVSEKQNQLRTSLLPQLIRYVVLNQKTRLNFEIFEFGKTYFGDSKTDAREKYVLSMAISREKGLLEDLYQTTRELVERFLEKLQMPQTSIVPFRPQKDKPYMHPYASGIITLEQKNKKIGHVFSLSSQYNNSYELKGQVFFVSLNFSDIFECEKKDFRFSGLSKFPPVYFDLSVIVEQKITFQDVRSVALQIDQSVIAVNFLDVYSPKDSNSKKSLTLSVIFRSNEKTFSSDEVEALQQKVTKKLADAGYPLRQ